MKMLKPEPNIKKASAFLIMSRLKVIIKDELQDMGIPLKYINIDDLLSYVPIRNMLIRLEFNERRKKGEKVTHIAMDMAEKHKINHATILSTCYRK